MESQYIHKAREHRVKKSKQVRENQTDSDLGGHIVRSHPLEILQSLSIHQYHVTNSVVDPILSKIEMANNNQDNDKLSSDLLSANLVLANQSFEIKKRAEELIVANQEKVIREKELVTAHVELAFQDEENIKRKNELDVVNKKLAYQKKERRIRASELLIANKELLFQNKEKENRAKELDIANKELLYQNKEKEKRAGELTLANIELAYQNIEKENRTLELALAYKELAFQNLEKESRAKELAIANAELHFQYIEKENRAKELAVANRELLYQNKEKEKRAAELLLANIELAYENVEKENRAKELAIANKELEYQNKEKEKRAAELLTSNQELAIEIADKEKRIKESIYLSNHDHLTGLHNRRSYEEELVKLDKEENLPITIIMGDINGLKMINDSFGHIAGDNLLKLIANIFMRICRPGDLVSRMGGDEFVIVIPKCNDDAAEEIIEKIKHELQSDASNQLQISASFGHATKTKRTQDIQELFQSAENHMYRHKLSETSSMRSQTIDLIMHTLFVKNPREADHSNRVGFICEKIASFLDLDQSSIYDMRIAGMMHDIGKIGISENILDKPGKPTADEWEQIKKHPEIGYRILSTTQEFSVIADYILQHHERWNGCGYPRGLKEEEILIQARIIAIADSLDAMTSFRTYRKELSDQEALDEIIKCSGTLYDPEIVKVFVSRYAEVVA
jgi:diguanylate cyclase (GGDEF)-like protein